MKEIYSQSMEFGFLFLVVVKIVHSGGQDRSIQKLVN